MIALVRYENGFALILFCKISRLEEGVFGLGTRGHDLQHFHTVADHRLCKIYTWTCVNNINTQIENMWASSSAFVKEEHSTIEQIVYATSRMRHQSTTLYLQTSGFETFLLVFDVIRERLEI